jgi:AcrR family transcriptional regulator
MSEEVLSRLDKQPSTRKQVTRRPYVMRRRADLVDATRERITAAAMRLHTSVGPSGASIAAIAADAGVTRLTVYNHFASQDEIFGACMAHWAALHPRPDVAAWQSVAGLEARARHGLRELYAWYVDTGEDLYPIHRDIALVPPGARSAIEADEKRTATALVDDSELAPDVRRRVLAVAGHLVDVETWRSLVVKQGLAWDEAAEVAVGLLVTASRSAQPGDVGRP